MLRCPLDMCDFNSCGDCKKQDVVLTIENKEGESLICECFIMKDFGGNIEN